MVTCKALEETNRSGENILALSENTNNKPLLRDAKFDRRTSQEKPVLIQEENRSQRWPQGPYLRPIGRIRRTVCCLILAIVACAVLLNVQPSDAPPHDAPASNVHWPGFHKIENWFAFGDSWTDTSFSLVWDQPSETNPLGNPDLPGTCSTNGANYVSYLITKYNQSLIKTYNLAWGGSVFDATIDPPMWPWLDLPHQVFESFLKYRHDYMGNDKPNSNWSCNNTLFSTFFGINDVLMRESNRSSEALERMFNIYEWSIDSLYNASARNFLIINVPPVEKSPLVTTTRSLEEQLNFAFDVADFNQATAKLAQRLRSKYPDITLFEYDVHDLLNRVISNPKTTPQTAGYKVTTRRCIVYDRFDKGRVPTAEEKRRCGGLDVDEFLWLNTIHVTSPVHDAMAAEIVQLLSSQVGG